MAVEAQHMSVEAQHLRLFKAATATSTRECIDKQSMYKAHMGLVDYADDYALLDPSSASCLASSVTMSNGGMSRKRARDVVDVNRQFMLEDDCLVAQHVERMRAEMIDGKIRFARQVVSLVDERVSKRVRAKDEEIEQMRKLNFALEEKMKTLATENQVWQYLAQTNEAAANALRANLQHVLAQQQEQRVLGDDAESCCGDNFGEACSTTRRTTTGGGGCAGAVPRTSRPCCCCRAIICVCARRALERRMCVLYVEAAELVVSM
ncbi:putative BOI-related E3 ubiquitin-protein ligase 3 [Iris pallida]|uniref:BOI-related E3 ubiquitin-protein ligase 3 n=1 Tax=Iris pallida TaxID=29817 RepID=A0AAX6GBU6_IRIPA|nr:putative BOI-related E3 ubiquitin-protein ligase 3 [Iris pallida]